MVSMAARPLGIVNRVHFRTMCIPLSSGVGFEIRRFDRVVPFSLTGNIDIMSYGQKQGHGQLGGVRIP